MSAITQSWEDAGVSKDFSSETIEAMKAQFEPDQADLEKLRPFRGIELNVRPDPIDHRDLWYEPSLVEVPSFNAGQITKHRFFGVRQQGNEGSCTGQALAAVVDLQNFKRFIAGADVPKRVSARMAYENARLYDDYPDDGLEGSSLRGAIKGFYHRGLCDSSTAPYRAHDFRNFEYNKEIKIDAQRVALGAYFRLRHVLNHYHTAIAEVGAILCSAIIHKGWEKRAVRRNHGKITLPDRDNVDTRIENLGGHAFAIIGYDDDGFLVLNSWGKKWGGVEPLEQFRKRAEGRPVESPDIKGLRFESDANKPLRGVAHWSYDDWSRHVLDAWVLRLTAPTRREAWYSGGFHKPKAMNSAEGAPRVESSTPRSRSVVGHYIHVRNGKLVEEPPYVNTKESFQITANIIATSEHKSDASEENGDEDKRKPGPPEQKYKHILLYAHGGLESIESASARAAAMTGVMKRHGIYPLFFFWRTGFGNVTQDIMRGMQPRVADRSQGSTEVTDHLLERMIEPIGVAIWRDIKKNASNCFNKLAYCSGDELIEGDGGNKRGGAWDALITLLNPKTPYKQQPKIHLAGHSAGVFMLGEMLRRYAAERGALPFALDDLATISLFAPTCTDAYFKAAFGPLDSRAKSKALDFLLYTLPDLADSTGIDGALKPYSRSLPYLVSNALEEVRGKKIVGLTHHWESLLKSDEDEQCEDPFWTSFPHLVVTDNPEAEFHTQKQIGHGEFDNSAEVMNHMLGRILGRTDELMQGFKTQDLKEGRF